MVDKPKPVIFLAFANDRGTEQDGYLRNLPDELRGIREKLEAAERAGLCELVERSNITLKEIFDVFQSQEYSNRIAGFHYGGHANSYQLLLESNAGSSEPAYAEGLNQFLSKQSSLQLIFLNGCSTEEQAKTLTSLGVALVIATSQAVNDKVAKDFAIRFYDCLANGKAMKEAFETASEERQAKLGKSRGAYREVDMPGVVSFVWPWKLHVKPGAEASYDLSLPILADDRVRPKDETLLN